MNRISSILCEIPAIQDGPETTPENHITRGAIRFENICFRYPASDDGEAPEVLRGIDFDVAAGSITAIVGPTGSGKSALVGMLTREYEPNSGRVLIDGMDLRTIPVRELRLAIGYVPQDAFIFSESIYENICMGRPAGEEEVRAACERAQFLEPFTQMAEGLNTELGERGVNLSGGQKQRLTLARALCQRPRILILDDAFSSIDTQTEERILQGLGAITEKCTSILISHRISTVRNAAQILVLDDGAIVERGRHAELLALGGLYARMYQRQLLEQALDALPGQQDGDRE